MPLEVVPIWKQRRPDFEKNNTLGVKSGVFSERLVSADAKAVHDELVAALPWLIDQDAVVLDVLCHAKARYDRANTYADSICDGEVSVGDSTGIGAVPERIWRVIDRAEDKIISSCSKLGMTPLDRAVLMRDTSWARALQRRGGEQLAEEGARLRALRSSK